MKKLFFFFSLLLPAAVSWAADTHWTPKTNVDYAKETVIHAQVNVNGRVWNKGSQDALEIGAFIDGECRAVCNSANEKNILELRVAGSDAEAGKTIVLRAFYKKIEYTFTKTTTFQGDATITEVPFVLNLDAITDAKVTSPIAVNQRTESFPYTVDLSQYVTLQYAATAKGESTPDVDVKVKGSAQVGADVLSFDGSNVTIKKAENANYTISVVTSVYNKGGREAILTYTGSTTLQVSISKISVTSISCDIEEVERFYAYDNLHDYLKSHLTILPANADNKEFKLECYDEGAVPDMTIPTKGGSFTVTIMAEDPDVSFKAPTVKVNVFVRPLSMSCNLSEMNIKIGEETKSAIEKQLVFTWPDQTEPEEAWAAKDLDYTYNPADLVDASGKAIKTGQTDVNVKLKEGVTVFQGATPGKSTVDVKLTIETAISLTWSAGTSDFFKDGKQADAPFAIVRVSNPEGESFDYTGINAKFSERYEGYPYATFTQIKYVNNPTTGNQYELYLTPKFIGKNIAFGVLYNGSEIPCESQGTTSPRINITAQPVLAEGWNWMAVYSNAVEVTSALKTADLIEVRSQKALLYNDANLGLFGDLSTLSAAEALYKVRANKTTAATLGNENAFAASQVYEKALVVGYNWINNPYEFTISTSRLSAFLNTVVPQDGDMLITKSSFAEYDSEDGSWNATESFALNEGEGAIYYTTKAATLTFNAQLAPETTTRKAARISDKDEVFTFNPHAFADNMAMIASIQGIENAEDYTVGVFVGDECRGKGNFVNDNLLFISAVGMSGEKMTFKLFNHETGEYITLNETLTYSTRLGSRHQPVMLTAPAATGINDVNADADVDGVIYNLAGQKVQKLQKGINIVNGKKVLF